MKVLDKIELKQINGGCDENFNGEIDFSNESIDSSFQVTFTHANEEISSYRSRGCGGHRHVQLQRKR